MGRFKIRKTPFEGGKRKSKITKSEMAGVRKGYLKKYNTNVSWYKSYESIWNSEDNEGKLYRKIVLPEEEINYEGEPENETDEIDGNIRYDSSRNVIIDLDTLRKTLSANLVCNRCHEEVKIGEDLN